MADVDPRPVATTTAQETLFAVRDIEVSFGGVRALQGVSLEVAPGQVHGVIGPNGAGKTTLFNVVCGFVAPQSGELSLRGRRIARMRPHELAGHGIARTLQSLGLFDRMSVLENVTVGADRHARVGFWGALVGIGPSPRQDRELADRAMAVLDELGIATYASRLPGSLPYPVRKKVALARALVAEPELLLLDEPASGLSTEEMTELGDIVLSLAAGERRTAVLLVEHHMDLVMRVCDRLTVLDFGKVIAQGTPAQVRDDPAVLAAYLGEQVEAARHDQHDPLTAPTALAEED